MTIENAPQLYVLRVEKSDRAGFDNNISILFDYIQDETSSVEADITDNYVESNYSLQDHIAIKPRMYRLRGCVGEVIYEDVLRILSQLQNADLEKHPVLKKTLNLMQNPTSAMQTTANIINGLSAIAPIVSNYTNAAMNIAKQIDSSYDRYYQIWQNFRQQNKLVNKRQKAVYAILMRMLQNRIPVKLNSLMFDVENETFYKDAFQEGIYENMYYLQSVSAHQGESAYITDIEVTIKEFRIATTKTTKVDNKNYAGMTGVNKAAEDVKGGAKGDTLAPEAVQKTFDYMENDLKSKTKEALSGHPILYNATKKLYHLIEDIYHTSYDANLKSEK